MPTASALAVPSRRSRSCSADSFSVMAMLISPLSSVYHAAERRAGSRERSRARPAMSPRARDVSSPSRTTDGRDSAPANPDPGRWPNPPPRRHRSATGWPDGIPCSCRSATVWPIGDPRRHRSATEWPDGDPLRDRSATWWPRWLVPEGAHHLGQNRESAHAGVRGAAPCTSLRSSFRRGDVNGARRSRSPDRLRPAAPGPAFL